MTQVNQDELVFLPLGGSNEVGMNLNAYGFGPEHDRKWIIVDVGVTFGDQSTPGVDVIVPDPAFLEGEVLPALQKRQQEQDLRSNQQQQQLKLRSQIQSNQQRLQIQQNNQTLNQKLNQTP